MNFDIDPSHRRDWLTVTLWSLVGLVLIGGAVLLLAVGGRTTVNDLPDETAIQPASRISPTGEIDLSRAGIPTDALPAGAGAAESDRAGVSIAAYGP